MESLSPLSKPTNSGFSELLFNQDGGVGFSQR